MRLKDRVQRFPKVKSPFERSEDINGHYTVDDEIQDGFEWVFENEDVIAVEKLHGTNCAVYIEETEQGLDIEPWTRHGMQPMQPVETFGNTDHINLTRAFQNSYRRGYLSSLNEGTHYGEVVGPDFHGNPHELKENLFIPFSWLRDKCSYKSWGKYPKTYEALEDWFSTELFSLFYARMHGKSLDEASVDNDTFCEGIIFIKEETSYSEPQTEDEHLSGDNYRKIAPNMAKLRRDMFSGYADGTWPMTEYTDHL